MSAIRRGPRPRVGPMRLETSRHDKVRPNAEDEDRREPGEMTHTVYTPYGPRSHPRTDGAAPMSDSQSAKQCRYPTVSDRHSVAYLCAPDHSQRSPHERPQGPTIRRRTMLTRILCTIGLHKWTWHAGPDRPVTLTGVCSRCDAVKRKGTHHHGEADG